MLEKPDLRNEKIVDCLQREYGLTAAVVEFLPLGADQNTAVYRVVTANGADYFLKLRSGLFDETSVALPKFFSDQGIEQVIAPLATRAGDPAGVLDEFRSILYPFVAGNNGYQVRMSLGHWADFGAVFALSPVELPARRHD